MMNCAFCGTKIRIEGGVTRQDRCSHCGRDLRCCKQCEKYDIHAYNECREMSADRIIDKERANSCDYFVLRGTAGGTVGANRTQDARRALENLFKKK